MKGAEKSDDAIAEKEDDVVMLEEDAGKDNDVDKNIEAAGQNDDAILENLAIWNASEVEEVSVVEKDVEKNDDEDFASGNDADKNEGSEGVPKTAVSVEDCPFLSKPNNNTLSTPEQEQDYSVSDNDKSDSFVLWDLTSLDNVDLFSNLNSISDNFFDLSNFFNKHRVQNCQDIIKEYGDEYILDLENIPAMTTAVVDFKNYVEQTTNILKDCHAAKNRMVTIVTNCKAMNKLRISLDVIENFFKLNLKYSDMVTMIDLIEILKRWLILKKILNKNKKKHDGSKMRIKCRRIIVIGEEILNEFIEKNKEEYIGRSLFEVSNCTIFVVWLNVCFFDKKNVEL